MENILDNFQLIFLKVSKLALNCPKLCQIVNYLRLIFLVAIVVSFRFFAKIIMTILKDFVGVIYETSGRNKLDLDVRWNRVNETI